MELLTSSNRPLEDSKAGDHAPDLQNRGRFTGRSGSAGYNAALCKQSVFPTESPRPAGNWSDYRFSVYLRSDDSAIGIVFRCRLGDAANPCRNRLLPIFTDRQWDIVGSCVSRWHWCGDYPRRGQVCLSASHGLLHFRRGHRIIAANLPGQSLVFDVTDDSILTGRIGSTAGLIPSVRFTDVRVDDLRKEAPVAYRFQFTNIPVCQLLPPAAQLSRHCVARRSGSSPDAAARSAPPMFWPSPLTRNNARMMRS